jgi:Na+/melibiose symporter-like transporter
MENEKTKEKKMSKIKKSFLRFLGILREFYSILGVVLFITLVTFLIIRAFPDYVPISNADNLLQIWITTNGVLMGFVGIIFAQLISSTIDQQNTLYQRILEEELSNRHRTIQLKKKLNSLNLRKKLLSVCTMFSLMFFAYSILQSMQNLAKNSLLKPTDTYAVTGFLFAPLLSSIVAMGFLIIALVLPTKPPLEAEETLF